MVGQTVRNHQRAEKAGHLVLRLNYFGGRKCTRKQGRYLALNSLDTPAVRNTRWMMSRSSTLMGRLAPFIANPRHTMRPYIPMSCSNALAEIVRLRAFMPTTTDEAGKRLRLLFHVIGPV